MDTISANARRRQPPNLTLFTHSTPYTCTAAALTCPPLPSTYSTAALPSPPNGSRSAHPTRSAPRFAARLALAVASAAVLLANNGVRAEIQGYYKGCQGRWQPNPSFREPAFERKFSAPTSRIVSIDCALACATPDDYAFLFADPTDATKTICACAKGTDPVLQAALRIDPIDDTLCSTRCSDREKCGGPADRVYGPRYSMYLIADPAPSKPSKALSAAASAAIQQESAGGTFNNAVNVPTTGGTVIPGGTGDASTSNANTGGGASQMNAPPSNPNPPAAGNPNAASVSPAAAAATPDAASPSQPTVAPPAADTSSSTPASQSGLPIPILAGAGGAAVVVVGIVAGLVVLRRKHEQKRSRTPFHGGGMRPQRLATKDSATSLSRSFHDTLKAHTAKLHGGGGGGSGAPSAASSVAYGALDHSAAPASLPRKSPTSPSASIGPRSAGAGSARLPGSSAASAHSLLGGHSAPNSPPEQEGPLDIQIEVTTLGWAAGHVGMRESHASSILSASTASRASRAPLLVDVDGRQGGRLAEPASAVSARGFFGVGGGAQGGFGGAGRSPLPSLLPSPDSPVERAATLAGVAFPPSALSGRERG
ncbi:hypothetical protein HDU96_010960 [Phlyctochytrium bullatum]|nr:hypothetical protein HDU96_010960 [Phlyctochytrium bullatum]